MTINHLKNLDKVYLTINKLEERRAKRAAEKPAQAREA